MAARKNSAAKVIPMTTPPAPPKARIGHVVGVQDATLLVELAGHGVLRARVAIPLTTAQADAAVAGRTEAIVVFAEGDVERPIVLGLVQSEFSEPVVPTNEARIDGKRVVLEGKEEVVLKCGEASLTLRANGKVVIRGAYVETRARGTNRIKGGSVQIN
ncbi:MAG TPA: DUF6484 domain-containing protein [Nannocystis sp.]|jgi:hypothetical protein